MYTVPPVPAPAHQSDADRTADLDAEAHAAAVAADRRFACRCSYKAGPEGVVSLIRITSPRTGRVLTMIDSEADRVVPGVARRVRTANGRATFGVAELRLLTPVAERYARWMAQVALRAAEMADRVARGRASPVRRPWRMAAYRIG